MLLAANYGLRVSGSQTIGRAELTAILAAVKIAPINSECMVEMSRTDKGVVIPGKNSKIGLRIYSDSQTSIQALKKRLTGGRTNNQSVVDKIVKNGRRKNYSIEICKVKAHIGIAGNEIADNLAKIGTERESSGYMVHSSDHHKALLVHQGTLSENDVRDTVNRTFTLETSALTLSSHFLLVFLYFGHIRII